jgi:hypothetical protein
MKTKALLLSIAVMFVVMGLNAQNTKIYNNEIKNESGLVKEYIVVDAQTNSPLLKNAYLHDTNGNRTEKISYRWSSFTGWEEFQRFRYEYIANNLSTVSYIKWDNTKREWNNKLIYSIYTDNNILYTDNF